MCSSVPPYRIQDLMCSYVTPFQDLVCSLVLPFRDLVCSSVPVPPFQDFVCSSVPPFFQDLVCSFVPRYSASEASIVASAASRPSAGARWLRPAGVS